jgi:hypothetical protein
VFPILLAVACLGLIVFGMLRLVKGGDGAAGVDAFKVHITGSSALIIIAMGLGGLVGLWFLDADHANNEKAPPSEATLAIPDEASFEASFADEPYTFGDDGDLDGLWLDCDAGAMQSCDDLYQQSPVDSEYEFSAPPAGCASRPTTHPSSASTHPSRTPASTT